MTAGNAMYNQQVVPELWDDFLPLPEYLTSSTGGKEAMLWMGPAGTVTPTHHDLTNNMVAQIGGSKRIWLVDSNAAATVYNRAQVYSDLNPSKIDFNSHPLMEGVAVLEIVLQPDELLFIPSGWWRQVLAHSPSITATFTNFAYPNDLHAAYSRRHVGSSGFNFAHVEESSPMRGKHIDWLGPLIADLIESTHAPICIIRLT